MTSAVGVRGRGVSGYCGDHRVSGPQHALALSPMGAGATRCVDVSVEYDERADSVAWPRSKRSWTTICDPFIEETPRPRPARRTAPGGCGEPWAAGPATR